MHVFFIPMLSFLMVVTAFLMFAFAFSYLVWSPKTKNPNVIAAEVMQFSEQFTNFIVMSGIALGVGICFLAIANFWLNF
ncbi:hypothetical protein Pse7367_2983 [Thalassoporum mexicanum PCC 7367]|uniref:hypothetical protein n=1 Tax=Thalassoporum mexicanum TaxID=3457544 RepID=UPI00029F882A|nr:hypothetical protein [Pseudanabaena sp. PCC 7367]AFY71234.1 hypothetical protein Pse7367_2983 [Pseudanabaena sp. PCC 7367]